MKETEFDIVVIGGGPAGLSAAIEAERLGATAIVLEAEDVAGGLTRSFTLDGYTFDCSGHLLHLADPEAIALVDRATEEADWNRIERDSVIFIDGAIVPYPFQLHLAHAPEAVRHECLALLPQRAPAHPAGLEDSFADWIDATLGPGIGRHFMVPYNEKLSTVPVGELTCEWLGRFVPQPSLEEIRVGAEARRTVQTGYNRSFLYPSHGGIAMLSAGLAGLVPNLRTGQRVVAVDCGQRAVRTADGGEFGFRRAVVSTMPLPQLAGIVSPGEEELEQRKALRANVVTCVNLGIRNANPELSRYQWIYLPGREFAAYRVGFYKRFADSMAPPNREGLYVEIAHGAGAEEGRLIEDAISDIVRLGVIAGPGDVETVLPVRIDSAYVIHDDRTASVRSTLHEALRRGDVLVAGRYGNWEYSAMEDAMVGGLRVAKEALGERAPT
jgi:protoporphyrinogen oxidase